MSLCHLVLVACAVLAVTCQNQNYSLTPTPCDEFCESRQRANCTLDDPEACVAACETNALITDKRAGVVPSGCEAPGERLTLCLLQAPPESFYCTKDKTGWRRELCAEEQDAVAACQYFSYSCAVFCGQQAQSCGYDPARCTESCRRPVRCAPEFAALYNCLDSGPAACTDDLRRSTRPDCGDQRALADACITDNPDYFRDLPPGEDGGVTREQTDATDGGALLVSDGGAP